MPSSDKTAKEIKRGKPSSKRAKASKKVRIKKKEKETKKNGKKRRQENRRDGRGPTLNSCWSRNIAGKKIQRSTGPTASNNQKESVK